MIRGKVIGQIWSSKHIETLPNGGLLKVKTDDGDTLIAFDPLGCAIDEYVLDNYTTDISFSQIEGLKHQEQQKYIKAAINELPELDALLVTLFYMNENTLDEIEKITGYTKTNINVRLFRARKKLYKSLEHFLNKELKTIL